MIILGIDPGIRTGLVWIEDGRILTWHVELWTWFNPIAWQPGLLRREEVWNVAIKPDRTYIEVPLDKAMWHHNPQSVVKCGIIAGIYLARFEAQIITPSDWLLSVANLKKHKTRRPSNDEIWTAFWMSFAPEELKKDPNKREYEGIRQRNEHEHIRDAAMIALYGQASLKVREEYL